MNIYDLGNAGIAILEAEMVRRARDLAPVARWAAARLVAIGDAPDDRVVEKVNDVVLTVGDLRRAAALIEEG